MSLYSARSFNLHITMALVIFPVLCYHEAIRTCEKQPKGEYVLPSYTSLLQLLRDDVCFNLNNCLFSCFCVGTCCCVLVCGYNHYHVLVLCHCVNCINMMFRCIIDEIQALPYIGSWEDAISGEVMDHEMIPNI